MPSPGTIAMMDEEAEVVNAEPVPEVPDLPIVIAAARRYVALTDGAVLHPSEAAERLAVLSACERLEAR